MNLSGSACLAAALALGAVLLLGRPAFAAVHAPKVVSQHTPDLHSLDDFVASVVRPGMSQKEKAEALWRAFAGQMYHWNNPQEPPCTEPGKYTDVTDPVQLMNVYGYTLCFVSAGAMEAVWRAGGLEAREFGLPGHVTGEVWYDGAYHYYDAEFKGYYPRPDGAVAGIEEIGLRPVDLMLKAKLPEGLFPYSRRPPMTTSRRSLPMTTSRRSLPMTTSRRSLWRTYMSKMVYAGIADEGPTWYGSHRARKGHVMNVSLRKGETYYRSWDNAGRYVCDYARWSGAGDFGSLDCRRGPNDLVSDRTFGNGILVYGPDLTTASDEYEDGVFAAEGIVKTAAGLTCAEGAERGFAVFRFRLPYVIAGDPGRVEVPDDTTRAAVLAFSGAGAVAVEISTDEGRSWQAVPAKGFGALPRTAESASSDADPAPCASEDAHSSVDLSKFVERRYGYLLKFVLAKGATLTGFRAETSFQLAPAALPALKRGANRMTFSLGKDPYEVLVYDPPVWEGEEAFRKALYAAENIKWEPRWSRAVSTADREKPGHLVYELKAPPGKRLRKLAIDLGGHLHWQPWHEDRVHLSVAANEPKDFQRLGTLVGAPYSEHWHRRLYREAAFSREQDVRAAYVRLDIVSRERAGMSECRFTLYFEDEKPAGFPTDGVLVTHGWLEAGRVKTHAELVRQPSAAYTVQTGEQFERPLFVAIEVPGRAGSRAASDPLGLAGYRPPPDSFFPPAAAGLSHAEVLSKLDAEGLEKSDTMVEILLHGKNRTVANEVAKMVGYRPVEAIRDYLQERVQKDTEDYRSLRGLALLDERKAPSRAAFLREYLPALKADEYGLRFVRKIGRTGSGEDAAPLAETIDKVEAIELKLALSEAVLTLGERSVLPKAAALVEKVTDPWQAMPVDAILVNEPAYAAAAKERLLQLLESPHQHLRWGLLKAVAEHARPGGEGSADAVAARALRDADQWIRLAGLAVLWRRQAGAALVSETLKTEEVPFVADACREFLAGSR